MRISDKLRLIQSEAPKPSLGTLLKQARHAAKIEQAQIADELGYSRQSISQFERDQVIPTRAVVIAWCVITSADFEAMDEAHKDAWREHNGGTKRTSHRSKGGERGVASTIHRKGDRYRPFVPPSLSLRPATFPPAAS
jgi:transcriptional regulator with XRE-family HTH domain